jgi:thioredoxin:protein disulfide reductase
VKYLIKFLGIFSKDLNLSAKNTQWTFLRRVLLQVLFVLFVSFLIVRYLGVQYSPKKYTNVSEDPKIVLSNWKNFTFEKLKLAKEKNQAVVVDIFADWCASCHELDQLIFNDPQFKQEASDLLLLKFDATKSSKVMEDLQKIYDIKGMPVVLFFDSKGNWRKDLTLTRLETKEEFLARLKALIRP